MDITSKAAVTVTAKLSTAEVIAPLVSCIAAQDAISGFARQEVEKNPTDLQFVSAKVRFEVDGSASVELVYEKAVEQAAPPALQPAQDAPVAAILSLALQTPGAPPAGG